MRGTKRSANSESSVLFNSNDSSMASKRVVMGSALDVQRAEPSLDMQRAESSRQHVRALNTQFASWVQDQLQNHPDELWDDGVQDYLNHSRSIMEKFSDVVEWLKANASKGESSQELRSADSLIKPVPANDKSSHGSLFGKPAFMPVNEKNSNETPFGKPFMPVNDKNSNKPPFGKPSFMPVNDKNSDESLLGKPASAPALTPSFGTSWGNNSFLPFTFGGSQVAVSANANLAPSNNDASNDADGEDDIEQPSSPSVKKSEEKGIVVLHEVKCKLYVKSTDPADKDAWKDKGMGQLSIKCKEGVSKGTKESKPTIVIRNDVGKVLLNALLYPGIKTKKQKNSLVAIFHTSVDGDQNDTVVARTFLMKTRNEEERDKLATMIQDCAPAA